MENTEGSFFAKSAHFPGKINDAHLCELDQILKHLNLGSCLMTGFRKTIAGRKAST